MGWRRKPGRPPSKGVPHEHHRNDRHRVRRSLDRVLGLLRLHAQVVGRRQLRGLRRASCRLAVARSGQLLGAIGLLVGIWVPAIGIAAAVALVLYFVGAVVTVLRARAWAHVPFPLLYLVPAAAAGLLIAPGVSHGVTQPLSAAFFAFLNSRTLTRDSSSTTSAIGGAPAGRSRRSPPANPAGSRRTAWRAAPRRSSPSWSPKPGRLPIRLTRSTPDSAPDQMVAASPSHSSTIAWHRVGCAAPWIPESGAAPAECGSTRQRLRRKRRDRGRVEMVGAHPLGEDARRGEGLLHRDLLVQLHARGGARAGRVGRALPSAVVARWSAMSTILSYAAEARSAARPRAPSHSALTPLRSGRSQGRWGWVSTQVPVAPGVTVPAPEVRDATKPARLAEAVGLDACGDAHPGGEVVDRDHRRAGVAAEGVLDARAVGVAHVDECLEPQAARHERSRHPGRRSPHRRRPG